MALLRRKLIRGAVALLALYALTLAVLLAFEDRLAFPGWTFGKPWLDKPAGELVQEESVRAADGNSIEAWWLPPPGWTPSRGAVLYCHGNGENVSVCGHALVRWRNELQTGALGFDYPGYGHSTGSPNEPRCYAAARAAFDWLVREKKVSPRDIVMVGQSMGSAIATEIAYRTPCRLLVISGVFTSFPDIAQHRFFFLPARQLVHSRFDNLAKIESLQCPVFIAHGTDDHVVPFAFGERLYAAAHGPKRFWPVAGGHHAQPRTPEFFEAVKQLMEETRAATPL